VTQNLFPQCGVAREEVHSKPVFAREELGKIIDEGAQFVLERAVKPWRSVK
jgi:hypothetical protein